MSKRARSCAPAAATSSFSAPPGPSPLTSQTTRAPRHAEPALSGRRPYRQGWCATSGRLEELRPRRARTERLIVIISHEYRFIFVKTRKTAGTSIEVLLGAIAGEDAVVTPVDPPVAGHIARNYKIPSTVARATLWRARRRGTERTTAGVFQSHLVERHPHAARTTTPRDSYFTFCFDRNPWDKVVSGYFFAKGRGQFDGSLRDYVLQGDLPSDFDKYSVDGTTVGVDFVGRYEHLEDDLRQAFERIGLEHPVALTREKGNFRPADARTDVLFDDEMSQRVETVFAREIQRVRLHAPREPTTPPVEGATPGSS